VGEHERDALNKNIGASTESRPPQTFAALSEKHHASAWNIGAPNKKMIASSSGLQWSDDRLHGAAERVGASAKSMDATADGVDATARNVDPTARSVDAPARSWAPMSVGRPLVEPVVQAVVLAIPSQAVTRAYRQSQRISKVHTRIVWS
jgi:hypothetical protein